MPKETFARIAATFRPFADSLEMDTWYREPDFAEDYRELWALRTSLSDVVTPHFELASVWRVVRDASYVPWLVEQGVKTVQLTLFGGEEMTDRFTRRRGAYRDILSTVDALLDHGIVPRIQTFVYRENLAELTHIDRLIDELALEERCRQVGGEFAFFLHQGSCEGSAATLYDHWITEDDIGAIPEKLLAYTYRYFDKSTPAEVFGRPESAWVKELWDAPVQDSPVLEKPVFFVDGRYDVYPNLSTPAPWWRLGNLWEDGAAVLENYRENRSYAGYAITHVPLGEMVRDVGNQDSRRLFSKGDYMAWVLYRYCEKHMKAEDKL